ncbi:hypothetical protein [Sporisorium scitamineum]|uniref:Uncharacterized protein n=1 Tax=Sporisorium scitamineum TaxID=49012 RepID=A0A0F7RSC1_9BASI|nr:hypothetical protein [Sporisorium scitamineum]
MSWLNSFDPAAPRNPAASSYRDSYATNESQPRVQQSTSSHAGPSTTRPNNGAPRQPLSGPHQTGRTTRLYQPSASSGSSSPAYTPRPRPPQRTRAAPPSAALRQVKIEHASTSIIDSATITSAQIGFAAETFCSFPASCTFITAAAASATTKVQTTSSTASKASIQKRSQAPNNTQALEETKEEAETAGAGTDGTAQATQAAG